MVIISAEQMGKFSQWMELGTVNRPDDLDEYWGASGCAGPRDLELSCLVWRLLPQPDRTQKSKTWVKDGKSRVKD